MSHFARLDFFRKEFNYGAGTLGTASISTTQNFTSDRDYGTLTLATGALLNLRGWRLFVRDRLILNNPDSYCINANGTDGGTAPSQTAGAGGTTAYSAVLLYGNNGGNGGNGSNSTGSNATSGDASLNLLGGNAGGGGNGGNGNGYNGGSGGSGPGAGSTYQQKTPDIHLLHGATAAAASAGGGGGGGGGGDGANYGGGGGGGGGGAGICFIAARIIELNSCVNASLFSAKGGNGGNGANGQGGNTGGGGGAGGSGGGFVYLLCDHVIGSCTDIINASGGNGGNGGVKAGSGVDAAGGVGGAYGGYMVIVHGRGLSVYQKSNLTTVAAVGGTGGTGSPLLYSL